MNCNYFVQIGAYGNKKYAIEAMNIINDDIEDITINEVYSSLLPGKLLNSVIPDLIQIGLPQITQKKK